ncbi:MAG: hypothetical protein KA004_04910 [Verrucomicrobiales bacterium]|nr:hypothetical protein [Verrucomicrobiales bacterium]
MTESTRASASASTPEDLLGNLHRRMGALHRQKDLGSRALGVPGWDVQLWQHGRELLQTGGQPELETARSETDLYLATEIYANGGHTALIGDFVRALSAGGASNPHLLVTNIHQHTKKNLPEKVRVRTGIPAENILILDGPSLSERLTELVRHMRTLRPRRTFFFHHPDDPLPCAAAQPEWTGQRVLVHHADSAPCFGLHLPGTQVIELNPFAQAMSSVLGVPSRLLPLCSPDPGLRPHGFLHDGVMVTASSGSAHKFVRPYLYSYADTVRVILQATGGRHVHIGPLDAAALGTLHQTLIAAGIEPARFVHVPWTESVANCLWEHHCDVYLSSFPIDGARTYVEVIASGTPYLRHMRRGVASIDEPYPVWRTWEELSALLHECRDRTRLQTMADKLRAIYESTHTPQAFARRLADILAADFSAADACSPEHEKHVLHSFVRTLTQAVAQQAERIEQLESAALDAASTSPRTLLSRLRVWFSGR